MYLGIGNRFNAALITAVFTVAGSTSAMHFRLADIRMDFLYGCGNRARGSSEFWPARSILFRG